MPEVGPAPAFFSQGGRSDANRPLDPLDLLDPKVQQAWAWAREVEFANPSSITLPTGGLDFAYVQQHWKWRIQARDARLDAIATARRWVADKEASMTSCCGQCSHRGQTWQGGHSRYCFMCVVQWCHQGDPPLLR